MMSVLAESFVIAGGTLICCDGSEPAVGDVLVENGIITAVGTSIDRHDAPVIDASGQWLMPGLINAHDHLDQHGSMGVTPERLNRSIAHLGVVAARNAILSLVSGVTTVRDLGSKGFVSLAIRNAVDAGEFLGPRILAAGPMIARTGGHGHGMNLEADGPVEVRRAVRTVVKEGADLIKLCASGGIVEAKRGENPNVSEFTQEELAAIVDEAHRNGLRATAHAHSSEAIKAAVVAGVDSIEHGAYLDREGASMMADTGVFLVPTLDDAYTVALNGSEFARPEWMRRNAARSLASRVNAVRLAMEAGVPIAIGTDVVGEIYRELHRLQDVGFGASELLESATIRAAELLGVSQITGSIEVGKSADLLVLNSNPLTNLAATQLDISTVVVRGQLLRPRELRTAVPDDVLHRQFIDSWPPTVA